MKILNLLSICISFSVFSQFREAKLWELQAYEENKIKIVFSYSYGSFYAIDDDGLLTLDILHHHLIEKKLTELNDLGYSKENIQNALKTELPLGIWTKEFREMYLFSLKRLEDVYPDQSRKNLVRSILEKIERKKEKMNYEDVNLVGKFLDQQAKNHHYETRGEFGRSSGVELSEGIFFSPRQGGVNGNSIYNILTQSLGFQNMEIRESLTHPSNARRVYWSSHDLQGVLENFYLK